jgi:hypothetical protein
MLTKIAREYEVQRLVGQCPGLRTILGQNLDSGVSVLAGIGIGLCRNAFPTGHCSQTRSVRNPDPEGIPGNPSHEEIIYQHFPNPVSIVAPADKQLLI